MTTCFKIELTKNCFPNQWRNAHPHLHTLQTAVAQPRAPRSYHSPSNLSTLSAAELKKNTAAQTQLERPRYPTRQATNKAISIVIMRTITPGETLSGGVRKQKKKKKKTKMLGARAIINGVMALVPIIAAARVLPARARWQTRSCVALFLAVKRDKGDETRHARASVSIVMGGNGDNEFLEEKNCFDWLTCLDSPLEFKNNG